ncbi:DUF4136 domain-containing protein [Colwellia sp. 1_MG-2023]|uniref:DUF4136 domain-containing protein n=1 Tax=Colwellia sp. 1_MG-2023 TaxID=3062649 RepID=UPI0026E35BCB|nr:DUF4136 domain-containing protein [Colwellia sp. 1_MG-2023]MDO6447360.1 DUF4136 domain-containing protein [Colwellia sp. 1_MG-2023]
MINKIPLTFGLSVLLLFGCSSQPIATAKFKSNFNFSNIESYSTYPRNSVFGESQNISYATRNNIETAIERSFDNKGLVYQSNEKANVIVGYHLIQNRQDLTKYNQGVKYCDPCLHSGLAVQDKKSWQVSPGSLVLDIVDQQDKRSVWRSVYPLKIRPQDNSQEVQDKIQQAVRAMMKTLPLGSP